MLIDISSMAAGFKSDVDAYYHAKKPYTELLHTAMTNGTKTSEEASQAPIPPIRDTKASVVFMSDMSDLADLDGLPQPDAKAVAQAIAAMRDASDKGKSKIKKSDWTQIDKILGR